MGQQFFAKVSSADPLSQLQGFDLCIVGAGVCGAALALRMAKAGWKIALVEKQWKAPERIVGELLQPDGYQHLKSLGLENIVKDIDAQEIHGYAIFHKGKSLKLNYPEQIGFGLRNRYLLNALRKEIEKQSNIYVFQGTAKSFKTGENEKVTGISIDATGASQELEIDSGLTIVSDGFFSRFRKTLHREKALVTGYYVGILLKNSKLPQPGYGHVFVGDEVKFLAYPTATACTRLLIEIKGKKPALKGKAFKEWLNQKIRTELPLHMHEAFENAIEEADFQMMPAHLLPARPQYRESVLMIGDALNMRNPLTGGGMTAGLTDVKILSDLLIENPPLNSEKAFQKLHDQYYKQRKRNGTINILADALNAVFSDKKLSKACVDYLEKGSNYSQVPLSLLSGTNRKQFSLLKHFFSVALFGALKQVQSNGFKNGGRSAFEMIRSAVRIVAPLLQNEAQGRVSGNLLNFLNQKILKTN